MENDRLKKFLGYGFIFLLGFFIATLITIFTVNRLFRVQKQEEINSRVIIDRIQDQTFLVTKTVVLDQKVNLNVDQGSAWSNFWWGLSIEAEALIRVDIGTDFSKLGEEDVAVDANNKKVIIKLPQTEILDASQYGDITVKSSRGVLKFFLENDPNQDHNEALNSLISEAKKTLEQDDEIFNDAKDASEEFLKLIIENMGYSLEIK